MVSQTQSHLSSLKASATGISKPAFRIEANTETRKLTVRGPFQAGNGFWSSGLTTAMMATKAPSEMQQLAISGYHEDNPNPFKALWLGTTHSDLETGFGRSTVPLSNFKGWC